MRKLCRFIETIFRCALSATTACNHPFSISTGVCPCNPGNAWSMTSGVVSLYQDLESRESLFVRVHRHLPLECLKNRTPKCLWVQTANCRPGISTFSRMCYLELQRNSAESSVVLLEAAFFNKLFAAATVSAIKFNISIDTFQQIFFVSNENKYCLSSSLSIGIRALGQLWSLRWMHGKSFPKWEVAQKRVALLRSAAFESARISGLSSTFFVLSCFRFRK